MCHVLIRLLIRYKCTKKKYESIFVEYFPDCVQANWYNLGCSCEFGQRKCHLATHSRIPNIHKDTYQTVQVDYLSNFIKKQNILTVLSEKKKKQNRVLEKKKVHILTTK